MFQGPYVGDWKSCLFATLLKTVIKWLLINYLIFVLLLYCEVHRTKIMFDLILLCPKYLLPCVAYSSNTFLMNEFNVNVLTIGASLVAQLVKTPPEIQETLVQSLDRQDPRGRDWLPTPFFMGFPGGSDNKESVCSVGDLSSIPVLGRSP